MDRKKCPDRLEISHPALVQEPRNVTWGSAVLQGVGGHPILCQHQLGLVFSTGVPFPEGFTDTHSIWLSPNGQCLQLDPWHLAGEPAPKWILVVGDLFPGSWLILQVGISMES